MPRLLTPEQVTTENSGGKAANLALLQSLGYPVPGFAVVPAEALDALAAASRPAVDSFLAGWRRGEMSSAECAAAIDALLADVAPDDDLCVDLAAWAQHQDGNRFAARSSANLEDGGAHSFAGQFTSLLDLPAADLPAAVTACRRSAFSVPVLEYCRLHGIDHAALRMSVVVQCMAPAGQAGVLFSANPQGILNEAVIIYGAGPGEGIVNGRVPVTTHYTQLPTRLGYSESQPGGPPLPETVAATLLDAAEDLPAKLGHPVDCEFAERAGQVWFLQVRPITGLDAAHPTLLDNSNIVESYPGVCTPLTASFAHELYTGIFRNVARRCLPGEAYLQRYENVLQNMVACVNGRMYYVLSNWYTILRHLPFQSKIIPVWQHMMGMQGPPPADTLPNIGLRQRLGTWRRLGASALGIPAKMQALHREFLATQADFERRFSPEAGPAELAGLYDDIRERLLAKWDITLLNDMYAFLFTGLVQSRLKRRNSEDSAADANRLVTAGGEIASLAPIAALLPLAARAAEEPTLLARLQKADSREEAAALLAEETPFPVALRDYVAQYGDRCMEELKLESETFRSDPLLLVQTLLRYAEAPRRLAELQARLAGKQEECPAPRGVLLRWAVKHARKGIAGRELSRLDRTRIFGMVRSIFLAMGKGFTKEGLLETPRDILYLTREEIFTAARDIEKDIEPTTPLKELVAERRTRLAGQANLPAYPRLVFAGTPFDKPLAGPVSRTAPGGSGSLRGVPCSGGRAEAQALLVHSPADAEAAAGRILVTPMTDPGWVFALSQAAGIISEKGSLLSHTAIVARELGVPFIAGVPDALARIPQDAMVAMDGNTGQIEVQDNG